MERTNRTGWAGEKDHGLSTCCIRAARPGREASSFVVAAAGLVLAILGSCACISCSGPVEGIVSIPEIQGEAHVSPLLGQHVSGIEGVVVAISTRGDWSGFWMQDPIGDGDPDTSDGIHVQTDHNGQGDQASAGVAPVRVGDLVRIEGTVEEVAHPGELGVTNLVASQVTVVAHDQQIPEPVRLGLEGLEIPSRVIDDDGLTSFDPRSDVIDFLESLEGMRVRVDNAVVVGPTSRYGEIVVLADNGEGASPRSATGGILAAAGDLNPERLMVDDLLVRVPRVRVGDRFTGPIVGIMHYGYGFYRIVASSALPPVEAATVASEQTRLVGDAGHVTVATFNVENLSQGAKAERIQQLARIIASDLRSPDVLALQEVQDDSGRTDNGVVTAEATLERLAEAIVASGGPRYGWAQIDPIDGREGGVPGGNIRVVVLMNPRRVRAELDGQPGPLTEVRVLPGARISPSPGRIAPSDPAFAGGGPLGASRSRRSLVVMLRFGASRLILINNHLTSKGPDDRLLGSIQPPVRHSEPQRIEQARLIRNLVDRLLAEDAGARVIVLGDLNELEFRPPVTELESTGSLTDLIRRVPAAERYTYVYQGSSQVLDHILVSPALAGGAEIDVVHVSSDQPEAGRASDHDPVICRLAVPQAPASR